MINLIAGPFYALGFIASFALTSDCPIKVYLDQYAHERTIVRCEEMVLPPLQPRRYQALSYEVGLHGFYLPPGNWICSGVNSSRESIIEMQAFEECAPPGP